MLDKNGQIILFETKKEDRIIPKRSSFDLSGLQFGKLKVIKQVGKNKRGVKLWECQCDCGNTAIITTTRLKLGRTTSCGCNRTRAAAWATKAAREKRRNETPYPIGFATIYSRYKRNAERRNYSFFLTKEELFNLSQQRCYYCNALPNSECKEYVYNGIDRLENSIGYTKDNCKPACKICNISKNELSEKEFLDHINKVFEFQLSRSY